MLFWTIVFFTLAVLSLLKGNLFYKTSLKMTEIQLKQLDGLLDEKEAAKQLVSANAGMLVYSIFMLIVQIVYLIKALSIDIYKYPTILMIVLMILIVAFNKKPDKETEIGRLKYRAKLLNVKRYSLRGFITSLMRISYFGYMFYIIVF